MSSYNILNGSEMTGWSSDGLFGGVGNFRLFSSIWAVMEAEMFLRNAVSVTKDKSAIMIRAAAMLCLKPSPSSLLSNMPQNPLSLSVFVYLSVFHFNAVLSVELSKKSSSLFLGIV